MKKCIVLGVTGGIAAFKACQITSDLVKKGYEVHVIMTKNACEFVTPLTFETLSKNRVSVDTFDRNFEYNVNHISLAHKADLFVLAPASANVIAKVANGIADDMLTTTFLACTCPKLICPAMNTNMLMNPITQDNIKRCEQYGMKILESDSGYLACGDIGKGRLADVETIVEACEMMLVEAKVNKKILISTGSTREYLDPIRYLTNPASGKTGRALAKAAYQHGLDVTLVCGNCDIKPLPFIKTINVTSANDMYEVIKNNADEQDIIIMSSAVADYTPANKAANKIKKDGQQLIVELNPTVDILKYLGEHKRDNQVLVGYCMETTNLLENARGKLLRKNCDMIVANTISKDNLAFNQDNNIVTIVTKDDVSELPSMSKANIAQIVIKKCLGE